MGRKHTPPQAAISEPRTSSVDDNRHSQRHPRSGRSRQYQTLDPESLVTYVRSTPKPIYTHTTTRRSYHPRFIPARFVRATFRLYISPSTDVALAKAWGSNPNRFVDWNAVERVDVLREKKTHNIMCPICLEEELVAPRITQCGHVFCYPCIMRCLVELTVDAAVSTRGTSGCKAKCPVCGELTSESLLKPVRFQLVSTPDIGSLATFCLVQRQPKSVHIDVGGRCPLPSPSSANETRILQALGYRSAGDADVLFQRIVLFDPRDSTFTDDLLALKLYHRKVLDEAVPSKQSGSDSTNVDPDLHCDPTGRVACVGLCYAALTGCCDTPSPPQKEWSTPASYCVVQDTQLLLSQLSDAVLEVPFSALRLPCQVEPTQSTLSSVESTVASSFPHLFYQLADGQFYYLDDLCFACLVTDILTRRSPTFSKKDPPAKAVDSSSSGLVNKEVSSSELLPNPGVAPQQVELPCLLKNLPISWINSVQVDLQFRERYPSLGHLPPCSLVHFVEVNLSHAVTPEVWKLFAPEFRKRRFERKNARRRQKRMDAQHAARAEQAQRKNCTSTPLLRNYDPLEDTRGFAPLNIDSFDVQGLADGLAGDNTTLFPPLPQTLPLSTSAPTSPIAQPSPHSLSSPCPSHTTSNGPSKSWIKKASQPISNQVRTSNASGSRVARDGRPPVRPAAAAAAAAREEYPSLDESVALCPSSTRGVL